jgi:hypothetical protein
LLHTRETTHWSHGCATSTLCRMSAPATSQSSAAYWRYEISTNNNNLNVLQRVRWLTGILLQLAALLQACARSLRGMERYRNDQRYLKVCVLLSQLCRFLLRVGCSLSLQSQHRCAWMRSAQNVQTVYCFISTVFPRALSVYLNASMQRSAVSCSQLHFQLHSRYKFTGDDNVATEAHAHSTHTRAH